MSRVSDSLGAHLLHRLTSATAHILSDFKEKLDERTLCCSAWCSCRMIILGFFVPSRSFQCPNASLSWRTERTSTRTSCSRLRRSVKLFKHFTQGKRDSGFSTDAKPHNPQLLDRFRAEMRVLVREEHAKAAEKYVFSSFSLFFSCSRMYSADI